MDKTYYATSEFEKRREIFNKILDEYNIRNKYNLTDTDADELFYKMILGYMQDSGLEIKHQRFLNICRKMDINELENYKNYLD